MDDAIPADGSPIRSDRPGSFPWSVLHDRHPAMLEQVARGHPYPPDVVAALERLNEQSQDAGWYARPFLEAENLFYARLLEAVGYPDDGPWRGIDPFEALKTAELAGAAVDDELAALDALSTRRPEDQLDALLLASLWGNRADLGFLITAGSGPRSGRDEHLLVDDRPALAGLLDGGRVSVVTDNAGRELLADLALVGHLLSTGRASSVVLQVKPNPYFVSDATMSDVLACLTRLSSASTGTARTLAERIRTAMRNGLLAVRTDPFWCTARPYTDLPPTLSAELAASRLTILKGDLNYRRLVEDRSWPATSSFAERTAYFPSPVVALRTCKSEVALGLGAEQVAALDTSRPNWRISGDYGVIQMRP
jgi:hypothetical protein